MIDLDEILQHHGVKGMKWGKRKVADIKSRIEKRKDVKDAKWEAKNLTTGKMKEISLNATNYARIKGVYKIPSRQIRKERLEKLYNQEASWAIKTYSPSGRKKVVVLLDNKFNPYFQVENRK